MRFDTPAEWLAWLENLHPFSIEMGLERVGGVWSKLAPQPVPFTVITVGGTNGKGSCVAMLEAVYRAAGYRTGAYTSPHLVRFNERIRLDGAEIDNQRLCEAFDAVDRVRGDISLTYFEFSTLAALYLFLQQGPDVVILEVGLGGRLDAVNIVDPDISLITSIALDHQAWLGSELGQIAREKAGIMRKGRPTVFAGKRPPAELLEAADQAGASLLLRDRDFSITRQEGGWSWHMGEQFRSALPLPGMRGRHQLDNAAAVLTVIDLLSESLPVSAVDVRKGLDEAAVFGRFQVIPGDILHVLDVAHNPEAAAGFAATLSDMFCGGKTYAVFGVLDDKDLAGVVSPLIDMVDVWCIAEPETPRASPASKVVEHLQDSTSAEVVAFDSLPQSYRYAREHAEADDRIIIFGSFFTVAEILPLIGD